LISPDEYSDNDRDVQKNKEVITGSPLTHIEVITHYLTLFQNYIRKYIGKTTQEKKSFLFSILKTKKEAKISYVFTVPAMYSITAILTMAKAAINANNMRPNINQHL
jgi:hypothetical protein